MGLDIETATRDVCAKYPGLVLGVYTKQKKIFGRTTIAITARVWVANLVKEIHLGTVDTPAISRLGNATQDVRDKAAKWERHKERLLTVQPSPGDWVYNPLSRATGVVDQFLNIDKGKVRWTPYGKTEKVWSVFRDLWVLGKGFKDMAPNDPERAYLGVYGPSVARYTDAHIERNGYGTKSLVDDRETYQMDFARHWAWLVREPFRLVVTLGYDPKSSTRTELHTAMHRVERTPLLARLMSEMAEAHQRPEPETVRLLVATTDP